MDETASVDLDRTGSMSGPPATDVVRRYEAIDAEGPEGYPLDHVALLLGDRTDVPRSGLDPDPVGADAARGRSAVSTTRRRRPPALTTGRNRIRTAPVA
ncbi:MAG: hypothetical protein ACI9YT_000221 [Halobacteriales archaeon]